MSTNPYQPPQSPLEDAPSETAGPKGLGGWLILVGLGLGIAILRLLFILVTIFLPLFLQGQWSLLTTQGSEHYHALWGPLIIFEIVGNLALITLAGYLLYLFFTKSHRFPRFFIGYVLLQLLVVIGDFFLANLIPAVASENNTESWTEMFRSIIYALIWIPYMLRSKRVKNTFVE